MGAFFSQPVDFRSELEPISLGLDLSDLLDKDQIGHFIGFAGRNIKSIEREDGVLMRLNGTRDDDDDRLKLVITGRPTDVRLAEIKVGRILINLRVDKQCHITQIPTKMIGFLIGKKGAKIDQIRRESGVKIDIANRLGEMTELRIYGGFDSIIMALDAVKDRLDNFGNKYTVYSDPSRKEFHEQLVESLEM